ncbi:phosphodiester glycosidase family protein [Sporichthya sp.]|uniref:phosphodiester glycosidase family protein n=1 Tax=Sporichthya sp. TaxID=65475 RepID=UPI00184ED2DF|nr:phosphodiester glycosidase family protein [Sporichthya sp.]MBA3742633.1 phosphodiester glycosidase family protein [Sporichthya sp.]
MSTAIRERLRRGAIGALALTLALITAGLAAEVLATGDGLPLGNDDLQETRVVRRPADGVKLIRISRGEGRADPARIGTTAQGPWRVRVLIIDPDAAAGHLRATFGADLGRTETVTELARYENAVAGTNGGFFAIGADAASRGNPVGLAIHNGVVESEPTSYAPETHFLLDAANTTARVTKLRWKGTLAHVPSGTRISLDHINEPPMPPEGCGGPRRDPLECLSQGEISVFTSEWGPVTPSGSGVEAVLDKAGCLVTSTPRRGTTLRPGQIAVQATGLDALSLVEMVALGCLRRTDTLTDSSGARVRLTPSTFAVNGRYQLLRAGKVVAPTGSGGFLGRNPRTIAGVTGDGRIVLITIDGRSPTSVGATMAEAAQVARSFGMVEAVNLDGGGSSVMSINGHASNKPSDGQERSVGDALVYVPAPWRPEI